MRIYIIGTGGVGGYFGGKLAAAGEDVIFFDRGKHAKAIQENGLRVNSVKGDFEISKAKVITKYSEILKPDIIIVSTKTYSNVEIFKELSKYVKPETVVVSLQNGIVNDMAIQKIVKGKCAVYPGLALIISKKSDPGEITHTGGLARIIFGARDGSRPEKLNYLEKAFQNAKVDAILSTDIEKDLWLKYIFICAFSGMTAITRSPIGEIVKNKRALDIYEDCVSEVIELGHLVGVKLADTIHEDVMQLTVNTVGTAKSSLLIDIESQRKTEIETLNGTLVHLAQNNNLDVPINKMIYTTIQMWEERYLKS